MTQQTINIGAVANDQSGDTLRVAFSKANANFTDLYTQISGLEFDAVIPSQTGNNGKYLTTNGSALSWGTISTTTNSLVNGSYSLTLGSNGSLTFPDNSTQTTAPLPYVKTAYNVSDATVTMGIITVSWSAQVSDGPRLVYTISNSSNITMQYTVTNIIAGVTTSESDVWTQHPSDPPFFAGALVNLGDIQIMYLQDMTNHKIYRITGVNTQGGSSGGHAYGSILIEQII